MTNEKIKKLQLEIAKTTEAQKKSEQKYKEKIKGLRKDGQRNSTEFHGMVENQSMISETGHRNMRRWERVLRCLRMRWQS